LGWCKSPLYSNHLKTKNKNLKIWQFVIQHVRRRYLRVMPGVAES
jgi:hypothetical protein